MSDADDYKYSLDKGPNSDIVRASHHMARVYHEHDMMLAAIDEVHHVFPMIERNDLMTLWIGINSANNNIGDME